MPYATREKQQAYQRTAARKAVSAACQRRWYRTRAGFTKSMLYRARKRAERSGIDFRITEAEIQIPDKCPILGIRLRISEGSVGPDSPSLDRKDPSKGYVPGNVWVISHRANTIKSDATLDELKAVVAALEGA